MWIATIIAFTVLQQVMSLRVITPNKVDPSAISNIELLVPLKIPKQVQSTNKHHSKQLKNDVSIDHDERYSAIPAFAFDFDEDSSQSKHPPQSQKITTRSLFLALEPPQDDQRPRHHRYKENNICEKLARQQIGELREVILSLCEELVEVLTPKCDCCKQERVILKKNWKLRTAVKQEEKPKKKDLNPEWWRLKKSIDLPLALWLEASNTRRSNNETESETEKTSFCGDCAYAHFRGGLLAEQRLEQQAKEHVAAMDKALYGKERQYVHKMQSEVDAVLQLLQEKQ